MLNSIERIARKFRRIILLQFGRITFQFHYGRILKLLTLMISGLLDVSMIPKTNYVYVWRHQDTSIIPGNPKCFFENSISVHFRFLLIEHFNMLEKAGADQS